MFLYMYNRSITCVQRGSDNCNHGFPSIFQTWLGDEQWSIIIIVDQSMLKLAIVFAIDYDTTNDWKV